MATARSGLLGGSSDTDEDDETGDPGSDDSGSDMMPLGIPIVSDEDHQQDKEEGVVEVQAAMLGKLRAEVSSYLSSLTGVKRRRGRVHSCQLCPFRSFGSGKPGRLRHHVIKYHTESTTFCASGTKQLRMACAIYDDDCYRGHQKDHYLRRSADLLRSSVQPPLASGCNAIDRHIRLVFTGTGPAYHNIVELQARDGLSPERITRISYCHAC